LIVNKGITMAVKKINAGLIGTGRIGKMHAENIVKRIPMVNLLAVADIEPDERWARDLGIQKVLDNPEELLGTHEIEAVVITTPSSTHVDLICLAAEAGKAIFCEKPVAFEPKDIQKAIRSVTDNEVALQIGFNRRFDRDFQKVKKTIEEGLIGAPHIIKVTNRDPQRPDLAFIPKSGGLFMDFCIHDFDTIRYLCDCEVDEIYASGAVLVDPGIGALGDIDTAVLTLTLSNGAIAVIDVSRETHYGYDQQIEVFGSKGSVRALNTRPTQTALSLSSGVYSDKPFYSFIERYAEAYVRELEYFFQCVKAGTEPSVKADDALQAVAIALAAKESYATNLPVRII